MLTDSQLIVLVNIAVWSKTRTESSTWFIISVRTQQYAKQKEMRKKERKREKERMKLEIGNGTEING